MFKNTMKNKYFILFFSFCTLIFVFSKTINCQEMSGESIIDFNKPQKQIFIGDPFVIQIIVNREIYGVRTENRNINIIKSTVSKKDEEGNYTITIKMQLFQLESVSLRDTYLIAVDNNDIYIGIYEVFVSSYLSKYNKDFVLPNQLKIFPIALINLFIIIFSCLVIFFLIRAINILSKDVFAMFYNPIKKRLRKNKKDILALINNEKDFKNMVNIVDNYLKTHSLIICNKDEEFIKIIKFAYDEDIENKAEKRTLFYKIIDDLIQRIDYNIKR